MIASPAITSDAARPRRRLIVEAVDDLRADLAALRRHAESVAARLHRRLVEVPRGHPVEASTYGVHSAQVLRASAAFEEYAAVLSARLRATGRAHIDTVHDLRGAKEEFSELLRTQQGIAGALLVGLDWQSPPIDSATRPTAGRHAGRVVEHWDDYKRDRHPDAAAFESAYAAEYLDASEGLEVRALATACGMAAFTTVLEHAATSCGPRPCIVAGRALYHECRDLLARRLGPAVHWVDEWNTAAFLAECERLDPDAIFVDSMCNARGLRVPDVAVLLRRLAATPGREVHVVVDNTCASTAFQPFTYVARGGRVRLLVFESLAKYAQFGFDRIPAGMIVAVPEDAGPLDRRREHLGTNITDQAAASLVPPARPLLKERLDRIERNACALASALSDVAGVGGGPVAGACYPGLERHPDHAVASRNGFFGGLLGVDLAPAWDDPGGHARLVNALLARARRAAAPLVVGASFGFDVTRVYRTATQPAMDPFVRIAAGTEDALALQELVCAIAGALEDLRRRRAPQRAPSPTPLLHRPHSRSA